MLRQRILTALVLIPVVVMGILRLPPVGMAVLAGGVLLLAAWEWVSLTGIPYRLGSLALLGVAATSIQYLAPTWVNFCLYLALAWWLLGSVAILTFPSGRQWWQQRWVAYLVTGLLFIPAWCGLLQIHQRPMGAQWVLLGCLLVWGADSGAYATGRMFGHTKLLPSVSPGKTWAGLYGALLSTLLISIGAYYWVGGAQHFWLFLLVCQLAVGFSVVGDLVESLFKRVHGVKDSGNLLPGHGGVLDRVDSMLAFFPMYALGLQILDNVRIMQ